MRDINLLGEHVALEDQNFEDAVHELHEQFMALDEILHVEGMDLAEAAPIWEDIQDRYIAISTYITERLASNG